MNKFICLLQPAPSIKENLLKALDISWKGILAIFIVISIVCIASVGLNAICRRVATRKAQKDAENQNKN
ncbi:MAG: hypothetical protein PHW00_03880 [Clostridia bacterium]|nr:hypothetical protein [Clostridia bacterium]